MAKKNVNVVMTGDALVITVDSTLHDEKSPSGKSFVLASTNGFLQFKGDNGKVYSMKIGVWELLPAVDRRAAEVDRRAETNTQANIAQGIAPDLAAKAGRAAAEASVKPLREPKADEVTVTTALLKARTTGIAPTAQPVTPPPAKPGKSRVAVSIAPRK